MTTYEKGSNQENDSLEDDARPGMEVPQDSSWSTVIPSRLIGPPAPLLPASCSISHGFLLRDSHGLSHVSSFLHILGFDTQDFHILGVNTQKKQISR